MNKVSLTKDGKLEIPTCGFPKWCKWQIMSGQGCFYAGPCGWKGKPVVDKKTEVSA